MKKYINPQLEIVKFDTECIASVTTLSTVTKTALGGDSGNGNNYMTDNFNEADFSKYES